MTADVLTDTKVRLLLDGLPDAAVIVDRELRPLAWNAAYTAMTGLRPRRLIEEATARKCHELLRLGICKEECLARRAFAAKRPLRVDEISAEQAHVPEPHGFTLVVQAIPLANAHGEVDAVLEIYRDVTAEARIQTRYKALLDAEKRRAEELERTVAIRTQELRDSLTELKATQVQLIQAEKLSSLGRLVSGIAHELNNPLNFIYANLDFLDSHVSELLAYVQTLESRISEKGTVPATADTEYVKKDFTRVAATIREGAERAITIVKGLRSFSHAGSTEGEPVSLRLCIDSAESLLHHELRRGNVKVVIALPDDLPSVFANQTQVEQVMINLLTNGAHAMAPKGGVITIAGSASDTEVLVSLTDEGSGIPAENLTKIFDPFFTTKAVGQGTGLGLSISRSIMLAWHGNIEAENVQPKGARFTLRFKRVS